MTEKLKANIDKYVKDTCIYYRSTHEDMLPNQFAKYLRSACVHFATEAYKEQLTKAKEHIENLLYYVKQCNCERSNYAEIEKDIKEAEQFLKEE